MYRLARLFVSELKEISHVKQITSVKRSQKELLNILENNVMHLEKTVTTVCIVSAAYSHHYEHNTEINLSQW